jgi:hypothetical protein
LHRITVGFAALLLLLAAPLALTASPHDRLAARGDAGLDAPPFQALEPCKYGHLPGEALYSEDFEAGAGGWASVRSHPSRPSLWHWTTFAGNNSDDDHLFHGGPGRLYYGIANAHGGTFNTDPITNEGDARSPPLAIPAGQVAVNLNTKWHVEWDRPTIYDGMMFGYIDVATGQRVLLCFFGPWIGHAVEPGIGYYINSPTGAWLITGCKPYPRHDPLCNQPETEGDLKGLLGHNPTHFDLAPWTNYWEPRSILLPASATGKSIQLLFFFREGDALINDATGWMVDDVAVVKVA